MAGPSSLGGSGLHPTTGGGRLVRGDQRNSGDSALDVLGIKETVRILRWFETAALVTTHLTSKAVARAIFNLSQWHVPYDSAELWESGYWGPVGEALPGSVDTAIEFEASVPSIPQKGDISSIVARVNREATFMGTGRGGVPPRAYVKYAVGYTADHAVVVHENPRGQQWNQDAWAMRNPKAQGRKKDHFLKDAYDEHRDVFSAAMRQALADTITRVAAMADIQSKQVQTGLAAPGRPRLVRR